MSLPPVNVDVPIKPFNRTIPSFDSQGFETSVEFLGADGSKWTIQFPPFPKISPISFTQDGKSTFTFNFEVQPASFSLSASFGNAKAAVTVEPQGQQFFPQFQSSVGPADTVADLLRTIDKVFSDAFPTALVGDMSNLREACAAARALMTPAAIDPTEVAGCLRAVALDLHLIPFQMQVNQGTLWGIAMLAALAATTVSFPRSPATDFIFGNTPVLYTTLADAISALGSGGGGRGTGKTLPKTNPVTGGTLQDDTNADG